MKKSEARRKLNQVRDGLLVLGCIFAFAIVVTALCHLMSLIPTKVGLIILGTILISGVLYFIGRFIFIVTVAIFGRDK